MSRTATLQPLVSPTSTWPPSPTNTTGLPFKHQPTYVTLTRMLVRFSHTILLLPASATLTPYQEQIQRDLRSSLPYHRTKWLHNIEHARTLLLQLEHTAQAIKVQRMKRDVIHDLAEKRNTVKKLRARIEEIGREVEARGSGPDTAADDEPGETLEQLLGRPPLQKKQTQPSDGSRDLGLEGGKPVPLVEELSPDNAATILSGKPYSTPSPKDTLLNVRRRRGKNSPTTDTSTTSGFASLSSTEATLASDSREQEALTTSLVSLTSMLKQQTNNFFATLQADKYMLESTSDGLEKNVTGMAAASKITSTLRRMSEGKGWWGRIMLYAWIFGLWTVAILLVFIGPKLRF